MFRDKTWADYFVMVTMFGMYYGAILEDYKITNDYSRLDLYYVVPSESEMYSKDGEEMCGPILARNIKSAIRYLTDYCGFATDIHVKYKEEKIRHRKSVGLWLANSLYEEIVKSHDEFMGDDYREGN